MDRLILRPHHILDIIATYGEGRAFEPEPTGSAVHTVAAVILKNTAQTIKLVARADDICKPCRLLAEGSQCTNMLRQVDPPRSMQVYNDTLDRRLLKFLGLEEEHDTTMKGYLDTVGLNLTGVARICTHPGEREDEKRRNIGMGLKKLGIDAAQG